MRRYKKRPVSRDMLEKILEAGRYAPTGGNRPDVHYVVIPSPEGVARLRGDVLESIRKMFRRVENPAVYTALTLVAGSENRETVVGYAAHLERMHENWERFGEDQLFYHARALILVHGKKWDDTIPFSQTLLR